MGSDVDGEAATLATTSADSGTAADPQGDDIFARPDEPRFGDPVEIGRGGMGVVSVAYDKQLRRSVAIKKVTRTNDTLAARRFEREVAITARLEHPNIVPIYECGRTEAGEPYYVMRRIEGQPLDAIVRDADAHARLALVPHVLASAEAVAYAHAHQIVHRDLKPSNILVGPFGETLVIDWGLARELGTTLEQPRPDDPTEDATMLGTVSGTPGFMPPEQAAGETLDARCDVFALGATLYYVLAGVTPFEGTTSAAVIENTISGNLVPLVSRTPGVPYELLAIVTKALAVDPAARYADARALAHDLRDFLAGQLVAAHRYTRVQRLRRFVRHHRAALAIGAVAIVALALTVLVAFTNIRGARDEARVDRARAVARADEMLVNRARMMTRTDPTSALALLAELPPESSQWSVARSIAASASLTGVTRRVPPHAKRIQALSFADDDRFLSAGADGTLQVHDLEARTSTTLVDGASNIISAEWFDDGRTIGYLLEDLDQVHILDTRTRSTRTVTLDTHVQRLVRAADGLFASTSVGLTRISADGSFELIAAGGRMVAVADTAEVFAVLTTDGVWLHRSGGAPIQLSSSTATILIAIDSSGTRIAMMEGGTTVTEVRLDDWIPSIQVYSGQYLGPLKYDGDRLLGLSSLDQGQLIDFAAHRHFDFGHGGFGNVVAIPGGGLVWNQIDGGLGLLQDGYQRRVPHASTRWSSLSASRRWIVAGSNGGELTTWRLDRIRPKHYWIGDDMLARVIGFVDGMLYGITGHNDFISYDLATATVQHHTQDLLMANALGGMTVVGDYLVLIAIDGPQPRATFEPLHGGVPHEISGFSHFAFDLDALAFAWPDGRVESYGTPPKVVWRASSSITDVAISGTRWLVVAEGARLTQIDRVRGATKTLELGFKPDQFALDGATTWIVHGSMRGAELLKWSDGLELVARFATLPQLSPTHHGGVIVTTPDAILWYPTTGRPLATQAAIESDFRVSPSGRLVASRPLRWIDAPTGEVLEFPGFIHGRVMPSISADGRTLIVADRRDLWLWTDQVPEGRDALLRWVADETNATLDASGTLSWHY